MYNVQNGRKIMKLLDVIIKFPTDSLTFDRSNFQKYINKSRPRGGHFKFIFQK